MRTYQQLIQGDRYQIYAFRKAHLNQSQIAKKLGAGVGLILHRKTLAFSTSCRF